MKKNDFLDIAIVGALGLASVLCVGITSVIGADETVTEIPPIENIPKTIEMRQENRAERKGMLTIQLQDRFINLASNVTTRLTSALERMSNISSRLDSRMKKLESLGVDTAPARAKLSEADVAIASGKSALSSIGSISQAIRGVAPRESFSPIRTQCVEVRDHIRQSHTLLRETVSLLKEAVRASEVQKGTSGAVTEGQDTPSPTE